MMQYLLRYFMAAYFCLSLTSRPSLDSLPFYISTMVAIFLYIDFLQKTKKNWHFLRTKKQKKAKNISAFLFLLIMIQIQIS